MESEQGPNYDGGERGTTDKIKSGLTAAEGNRIEPQHLETREPGEGSTMRIKHIKNRTGTIRNGSNKYGGGPDKPVTGDARSNSERDT